MWRTVGWKKILIENKKKKRIYLSCVRLVLLYGSKTRCLRKKKLAILRRIKRSMMDRKNTDELMDVLELMRPGIRWQKLME